LPAAIAAAREGRALIVPAGNGEEAAIASGVAVFEASSLLAVAAHLHGRTPLPRIERAPPRVDATECADLADVRGQFRARRALEIAAAGGHSLLPVCPIKPSSFSIRYDSLAVLDCNRTSTVF